MSKALPWYKRTPADWQRGTRKHAMSFELRGFYSECLDAMWELQDQLPKNTKQLAMMLGSNPRQVRALMAKLIVLGKMVETVTGYYNPRMMADILGVVSVPTDGPFEVESRSNGAPIEVESTSKIRKKPMITTREVESEEDSKSQKKKHNSTVSPRTCDAALSEYAQLEKKLIEACNGSLANPAAAPGLLNLSVPMWWIEQGCDLDRDVIPTLREVGTKRCGAQIKSWEYFTSAVTAAKARRLRPLPDVASQVVRGESPTRAALNRRIAKAEQEAAANG